MRRTLRRGVRPSAAHAAAAAGLGAARLRGSKLGPPAAASRATKGGRWMSDRMRPRLTRRQFVVGRALATGLPLLSACAPAAPQAAAPAPAATTAAPPPPAAPTTAPAPAAVATVAAKPAPTPAPAASGGAIKRGGTLIHSTFTTYTTMDPHLNASFLNPGYDALYNGLVRFELVDRGTGQHKVVGDLAESWDQPDPTTLIFKLRQGVQFHDGSPFDASVAAWNFL